MAHACYVPEGIDAARLVQAIAREHGLRLTGDVPQRLATACGGDRAILTREIEKLALYLDAAPERPHDADGRALDAIGADLGDSEMFEAIEAVVDGRVAEIGAELARIGDGMSIPLLRSLSRRLLTLAELRGEVEAGATIDEVIEKHRIFFREKGATARAAPLELGPTRPRRRSRLRSRARDDALGQRRRSAGRSRMRRDRPPGGAAEPLDPLPRDSSDPLPAQALAEHVELIERRIGQGQAAALRSVGDPHV
jgi:DNA polymerase-3 subunit delta